MGGSGLPIPTSRGDGQEPQDPTPSMPTGFHTPLIIGQGLPGVGSQYSWLLMGPGRVKVKKKSHVGLPHIPTPTSFMLIPLGGWIQSVV